MTKAIRKDRRHLDAEWRATLHKLESDGGAVVRDDLDSHTFWHRAKVRGGDAAKRRAWLLLEHPPGESPGRVEDAIVFVDGAWRVVRCMPDRMWARFEAFMYRLESPCPKDRYSMRQF